MHQFDFTGNGANVHRFSGIGNGEEMKFDPEEDIIKARYDYQIINKHQLDQNTYCPLRTTILPWKETGKVFMTNNFELEAEEEKAAAEGSLGTIFTCPNYPCQGRFLTYHGLQRHELAGNCKLQQPHPTLKDITKTLWVSFAGISSQELYKKEEAKRMIIHLDQLPKVETRDDLPREGVELAPGRDITEIYKKGFGLPISRPRTTFNDNQKAWLEKLFNDGMLSGRKARPYEVEARMKLEKEKGVWKFSPKEWLDEDQIKQAFSRIATTRKKTKAKAVSAAIDEEEEEEDMIAEHDAIDEQEIVLEIQRELEKHEEIDIDLSHPMKVHEILRIIFSCKFL